MASKDLIYKEENGGISFGDYQLSKKTKVEDYPIDGDLYKVKSFAEITKLEKNGMFLYESVPGTNVENLIETADGIEFTVSGNAEAQITVELMEETSYKIFINDQESDEVNTNLGGKLSISVDLSEGQKAKISMKQ